MKFSVSQYKTALLCYRKWLFEKVLKLPREEKDYFDFGTIFHACAERYLNGEEPFPEGWYISEAGKPLSKQHQELIPELIAQGIDQGILVAKPGQQLERFFSEPLTDGIEMIGYIDVYNSDGVEDHKTPGDRKWILSQNKLAQDPQALTYAKIWLDEYGTDTCAFSHNNFTKDNYVRQVTACVTHEACRENWEDMAAVAVHLRDNVATAESWDQVEGPNVSGGCRAFGGCDFADICGLCETVEDYTARITRLNSKETSKVNAFEEFKKKRAALANGSNTPPAPPAKAAPPTKDKSDLPPHPKQPAEGGSFGSVASKRPTATPPEPPKVEAPAEPTPPPPPAPKQEEEDPPKKGRRGRPRASFTLYINCRLERAPKSRYDRVTFLENVYLEACQKVAERFGKHSYDLLPVFGRFDKQTGRDTHGRRDLLCALVPEIAETLKGKTVIAQVRTADPDFVVFVERLRAYADMVVTGDAA